MSSSQSKTRKACEKCGKLWHNRLKRTSGNATSNPTPDVVTKWQRHTFRSPRASTQAPLKSLPTQMLYSLRTLAQQLAKLPETGNADECILNRTNELKSPQSNEHYDEIKSHGEYNPPPHFRFPCKQEQVSADSEVSDGPPFHRRNLRRSLLFSQLLFASPRIPPPPVREGWKRQSNSCAAVKKETTRTSNDGTRHVTKV